MISLQSSDQEILSEMERLLVLYRLKTTLRYDTKRSTVHTESVAEHLYAMHVLANYFLPLEDPEGTLDKVRVYELITFHELGEIETGDIVAHWKTDDQKREEGLAAGRVAERLPESICLNALKLSQEFESKETPEAVFANAIDKIEPIFEVFEESMARATLTRLKATREQVMDRKYAAAKEFPYIMRFLQAWEARAVSLSFFSK